MNLDHVLSEIKRKGRANLEAIAAHRSIVAGKRGATGLNDRKSEMRGICRPIRRKVSAAEIHPLPNIKTVGKPLACTGAEWQGGDGYTRDRITGTIRRA